MIVSCFTWDDVNIEHIARHHVIPDEVEEIFESNRILQKTYSGRYIALGRSMTGRYLTCVFEKAGSPSSIRVITARDMDEKERKLFKKKAR